MLLTIPDKPKSPKQKYISKNRKMSVLSFLEKRNKHKK